MKQETKDLIDWIKTACFNYAAINGCPGFIDKAYAFLDSLKGFEKQLKLGGYLPDINNKACKNGDKIRVVEPEANKSHYPEFKKGDVYILHWDPLCHEFSFQDIKTKDDYFFSYEDKFEKV